MLITISHLEKLRCSKRLLTGLIPVEIVKEYDRLALITIIPRPIRLNIKRERERGSPFMHETSLASASLASNSNADGLPGTRLGLKKLIHLQGPVIATELAEIEGRKKRKRNSLIYRFSKLL